MSTKTCFLIMILLPIVICIVGTPAVDIYNKGIQEDKGTFLSFDKYITVPTTVDESNIYLVAVLRNLQERDILREHIVVIDKSKSSQTLTIPTEKILTKLDTTLSSPSIYLKFNLTNTKLQNNMSKLDFKKAIAFADAVVVKLNKKDLITVSRIINQKENLYVSYKKS